MVDRVLDIVQPLYDRYVRELFPRTWIVNNGVPTRTARWPDLTKHRPDCKEGSVRALRRYVRPDDHTVVIGGGDGVTAVVAARRCARVTVYEAASEMIDVIEETAEINRMDGKIDVEHAAVGPTIDVYGDEVGAPLDPADLPACDVLEMDCEGAEAEVLDGLDQWPRVIVVEVHPQHGVQPSDIRERLESMGYEPVPIDVPGKPFVLVGLDDGRNRDRSDGN